MFHRLHRLDERIVKRMAGIKRPVIDKIMVCFTYAGTAALIWWALYVLPLLIAKDFKNGIILTTALGINYLLGEIIIKKKVGRDRPSARVADEEMKIQKPKDPSFPSGHSASSFCALTVLLWNCPWWMWLPAIPLAALIAFSRIYLRVHYFTDVLGGVILGLLDGTLVTLFFRLWVFRAG